VYYLGVGFRGRLEIDTATTVTAPRKLRADDVFFPAMGLLILGIVVTGFGKSYFLAGMVRAKLPNGLVHVHGRRASPDEGPELLLVGDLEILLLFVVLTSWGLLARRDAAWHKRLMILGTMAIMGPAIGRWYLGIPVALGVIFALPLLVVAYDLWILKRIHRTTAVATLLTAAWVFTIAPFSKLAFWHQCVNWI
jgi:hypothetical protein